MSGLTDPRRILVVGAGATGGYFGGRLAEAGRDVTFLVRPGRAAQLAADGLQIVSEHGDLTLHPRIVTAEALASGGPYDLILLSVKAYGLEQALVDIAPAVGRETMILPLLNGLSHMGRLVDNFGQERVLGGVCVVSATLDDRGRVIQLAGMQDLTYGPVGHETSTAATQIDSLLQGCGFTAKLTRNIMAAMWQKWIMLSCLGAFNCLMRGTVGEIVGVEGGLAFADALLDEAAAIAAAAGYPLREAGRAQISALMTTLGSGFSSSMYRDLQAGRRVEVDSIVGDLVGFADRYGVRAPLLELALVNLRVYQSRIER